MSKWDPVTEENDIQGFPESRLLTSRIREKKCLSTVWHELELIISSGSESENQNPGSYHIQMLQYFEKNNFQPMP